MVLVFTAFLEERGGIGKLDGVGPVDVNLFIYQARESSLVPAGFLTAQFLQNA